MNDIEENTCNLLGLAWNEFLLIEDNTQDDIDDFRNAIHTAQRIVASRAMFNKRKG